MIILLTFALRWQVLMGVLFVHSELIWLKGGCSNLSKLLQLRTYINAVSLSVCRAPKMTTVVESVSFLCEVIGICVLILLTPSFFNGSLRWIDVCFFLYVWVAYDWVFTDVKYTFQEKSSAVEQFHSISPDRWANYALFLYSVIWQMNRACYISYTASQRRPAGTFSEAGDDGKLRVSQPCKWYWKSVSICKMCVLKRGGKYLKHVFQYSNRWFDLFIYSLLIFIIMLLFVCHLF